LKGTSAGQRHTDRQTNSAENNGPLFLQLGQQTDGIAVASTALASIVARCNNTEGDNMNEN